MKNMISAALLLFSASAMAAAPGLSDKEIVIGAHTLDSGMLSMYSAVAGGAAAYYDMVNEKGGVNGRKIKFIRFDTHSDWGQGLEGTKKLVEQDKVFAVVGPVGIYHMAAYKYLIEQKVPSLFTNDGSIAYTTDPENNFVFPATYSYPEEGKALGEYMAKTYAGKKVCLLVNDHPIGRQLEKGVTEALTAAKMTPHTEVLARDANQSDAEMGRLKGEKCEVVFTTHIAQFAADQINYGVHHGFKPKWVTYRYNVNDKFLELVDASMKEGIVASAGVAAGEGSGTPGWEDFKKAMAKNNIAPSGTAASGWYIGELFVHALKEADKKWGKKLDREKFVETVQNMKGWTCSICYEPINFSPKNHWPLKPVLQVSKGGMWSKM